MTPTSVPRRCPALFYWIIATIIIFSSSSIQAQTLLYSEDFESWNGSLTCLSGWNCGTTNTCTSGLACNWGRNDIFGTIAQPAASDCDGSGFYARCNTSQMVFGDVPSLVTPNINLSAIPATDPVDLSFCIINTSSQLIDSDGFQVSFSNNGGVTWQAFYLDFNVYSSWTNLVVSVPGTYRSASFRIRFDGLANLATGDIGLDEVVLMNNALICEASASTISVFGPTQVCRDSFSDVLMFSQTSIQSPGYAYIITDTLGYINTVLADNDYDFNELAPEKYEIIGVSYSGLLSAELGKHTDSISATGCHILSTNKLKVSVQEITASAFVVSDYNGVAISKKGARDGAVTVATSGGSGVYGYTWNTTPVQTSNIAIGLGTGVYTATVSDTTGCVATASVSLSEPDSLGAVIFAASDFNGSPVSCSGAADGIIKVVPNGGVGGYSYKWLHNPSTNSEVISGLSAGFYTVTVKDANGADKTVSLELTDPAELQVQSIVSPVVCSNQADGVITLHASGGTVPYTYDWEHGPSTPSLEGLSSGIYRCKITDANGCSVTEPFTLTDIPPMAIEGVVGDNDCFAGQEGYIAATVNGGTGPYLFSWSTGEEVQDVFHLAAGSYSLTVADSKGCTASRIFEVSQPEQIVAEITTKADNGRGIGSATVSVSGGIPPYEYYWSNGDNDETANGLRVGTYSLTIRDASGCEMIKEFEVSPNDRPDCVEIHIGFSPNGDGINETLYIPCIEFFPQNKLTIVNRWGQELFYAEGYDNLWEGTVNGQPLPDGTYFYILEIQTTQNRRQFKGTVNIVR
ncbi:MAG: gliding motility-associated C-terminal domain-containing protein [Bacteroidia bacterium]|nr:gliding motility-associated C-terminal domain-containing protein [Bacteroidia bacterium]